jgi:uncharacterized membrane protein YqaE (UPF0057 family)
MEGKSKIYLMVAGTFLPAFTVLLIRKYYTKDLTFNSLDIILFAGAAVLGGFITAKMLQQKIEG